MRFKIAACNIIISPAFCCVITLLLLIDRTGTMGVLLCSAFIHEIGHCLWMALFGCLPESIRFLPFEIDMVCSRTPQRRCQQLLIALGGVLANGVCVCFCKREWQFANLYFALFNSLPIISMDGYQVLSLCLQSVSWREMLLQWVSVLTLIFLGMLGVWYWFCFGSPLLFLFVLYMSVLQIRAKSG